MADPNLAVLIFLVVLLTQVVAWIGKSVLQEAAFSIYSSVLLAKAQRQQTKLRKQVLEDKAELGRTSSQDEFAKWAKLKRKLDKGLADLEKTSEYSWQQVATARCRPTMTLTTSLRRDARLCALLVCIQVQHFHLDHHHRRPARARLVVPPPACLLDPGPVGPCACGLDSTLPERTKGYVTK